MEIGVVVIYEIAHARRDEALILGLKLPFHILFGALYKAGGSGCIGSRFLESRR